MNALSMRFAGHTPRHGWSDLKRQFAGWWQHSRSRSELESLSDECLQDIGVSRCSAEFEAAKPFWMA
jgi:uncharacterized protein YjiS (DUF1127 family)